MNDDTITIVMSEVVRYERKFYLHELAEILDCEPTREACLAALDLDNSNYGTADEFDESLLNALIPPHAPYRYLASVEDREWGVS